MIIAIFYEAQPWNPLVCINLFFFKSLSLRVIAEQVGTILLTQIVNKIVVLMHEVRSFVISAIGSYFSTLSKFWRPNLSDPAQTPDL